MSLASSRPLRIVYFGTTGRLSAPPLRALLDAGMDVRAVVLPALSALSRTAPPITSLPHLAAPGSMYREQTRRVALPMAGMADDRNIVVLAADHGLPLFEVARLAEPRTLATLADFAPEVICVACFPLRLPPALLALPPLGALNLHPSLLPDNRGPDPLFWTFQRDLHVTGVTIHRMDKRLDTGPILAQQRVAVREGITEAALERELAHVGAGLLARVVEQLREGTSVVTAQDESRATHFPWPSAAEYEIVPSWPAHRAYTFARGIQGRAQAPLVRLDGATFAVREPLGYDASAELGFPWRLDGDALELQCSPGAFSARVTPLVEVPEV